MVARVGEMQGVPAHITTLKSDGIRRHPAPCVFADGKGRARRCMCPQSPVFYGQCTSAAKCDFYKRKEANV